MREILRDYYEIDTSNLEDWQVYQLRSQILKTGVNAVLLDEIATLHCDELEEDGSKKFSKQEILNILRINERIRQNVGIVKTLRTKTLITKRCSKCGQIKLATETYFSPDKRNSDGLHSVCKECRKFYVKKG